MSILDVKFLDSGSNVIYDHITSSSDGDETLVRIQNLGEGDLRNLGIYLTSTSDLGDVDNPPDYTPASALQTIIDWGQKTVNGTSPQGGLKLIYNDPVDNSEKTVYFSRSHGSSRKNRIKVGYSLSADGNYNVLPSGGTLTVRLVVETPPSISAKRLFVNIGVA